MLRKINSLLSALILIVFAGHLFFMSGLLTGLVGFNPNFKYFSFALLTLVLLHTLFGFGFMFERIIKRRRGQKSYTEQNKLFSLQMVSGILLLALVVLHTTAYGYTNAEGVFILRTPSLFYYVTECLLALFVCLHSMISLPRLCVSFGMIQTASGMKKVCFISLAIFAAVFAIAVVVFSLYYLPTIVGGLV